MPRKQNGFGNTKSFAVSGANKINHRTDKGKGRGAAGQYPSNRRYGSSVTRSVIEQWDLDSAWARWRRGMEYYYQGAYLAFEEITAVLFQGTSTEIPVTFSGYRFATKNSDSRTHYAIQRTIDQNAGLGYVDAIYNDPLQYSEQFQNKEIWMKVVAGNNPLNDVRLMRTIGERIETSTASANVVNLLNNDGRPAIYQGKSGSEGVKVHATAPLNDVLATDYVQKNGAQGLVGKIVYMPDFYTIRAITILDVFKDFDTEFTVSSQEVNSGVALSILDTNERLPPTLGDIDSLTPIYSTSNQGTSSLQGEFRFRKSDYQRFFGKKYLTAEVVRGEVNDLSYAIMPFVIQGVKEDSTNNLLEITSIPFQSTLTLQTPAASERIVVLADNSFTTIALDYDANGNYNHAEPGVGEQLWKKLNLDIDPWQDQTFEVGDELLFADLYTCSCPAYLRAKIRNPEVYDEVGRKLNRQDRAPLPTAKGSNTFDDAGILKVAGIIDSWATTSYKRGFKVCKHTIAAMFINKIRVQEPNTFPSYEAREAFEQKLAKDIQEVAEEFKAQLMRSEITTVEIVYALAEALNLDDVELGYVMQTASF